MYIDGAYFCETLEDQDRHLEELGCGAKIPEVTSIPRGTYKLTISHSPKFGYATPELLEVPCYEYIRIHKGNWVTDTEGCLLVGKQRSHDGLAGGTSGPAFNQLMEVLTPLHEYGIPITIQIV
jgi:hypothetical protein